MRRLALIASLALLAAAGPAAARDGTASPDRLVGTPRADVLHGGGGGDRLSGRGGADTLRGERGPDRISGGSGADTLIGASGGDVLSGDGGDDAIAGGFGADAIAGGPGDDLLEGDNDADLITGGDGDDTLVGGSGVDRLDGGRGDDRLFASSGADRIFGGDGNDEIVAAIKGISHVDCGAGDDTLIVLLATESDRRRAEVPTSAPTACEHVYTSDAPVDPARGITYLATARGGEHFGTDRDDTLLGAAGPDLLHGGAGNDVLWGQRQPSPASTAPDGLDGGSGADTLYGGPGPQVLYGGDGNDLITSGLGAGVIAGGGGADVVVLRPRAQQTVDLGDGDDRLDAGPGTRGHVVCGAGEDTVSAPRTVRVASDCEHVSRGRRARDAEPRRSPRLAIVLRPGKARTAAFAVASAGDTQCKVAEFFDNHLGAEQGWGPCAPLSLVRVEALVGIRRSGTDAYVSKRVTDQDSLPIRDPLERLSGGDALLGVLSGFDELAMCSLDGGPDVPCERHLRELAPGTHTIRARELAGDGIADETPTITWTVGPTAGFRIAAASVPPVVERTAALRRRPPRASFALSAAAVVTVTLRHDGRNAWSQSFPAESGPQSVALPGALLAGAAPGRWTVGIRALGRAGASAEQTRRFALARR